ncbi:hypothetical protein BG015_000247 [Linnemannia schmuckeri]|uniref:Uncharacterized protein n=1 Tax=Linnemannia schmuckeri TaxID=64567 RepID=A0A9P5RU39_9FUNG|nr:hypothetical protein BG015_000247 [Linnemannia schmuckeri]
MGRLNLQCITLAGSRFIGMAYTTPTASYENPRNSDDFTHVVLIQSNFNPRNLISLSWSLISAWPRIANVQSDIYSSLTCHVNPETGVFTMMSNFSGNNFPSYYDAPQRSLYQSVPLRRPGGFQYTPSLGGVGPGKWADFVVNTQDYEWGNVSATFDVFSWPGTSDLYQARIGNAAVGTIHFAQLTTTAETIAGGPAIFINVANYTLNPDVHGYPMKVAFANNSIYQLGRLITDKRTGEFGYFLTRIPLDPTKTGAATFQLPANLVAYDASAIKSCQMETTKIWYSSPLATLFVFCPIPVVFDRSINDVRKLLLVSQFRNGDKALSTPSNTSASDNQLLIQPIDRSDSGDVWAYLGSYFGTQYGVLIDPASNNVTGLDHQFSYLTIPDLYGHGQGDVPRNISIVEEHLSLIIAGAVVGFLLILAAICYIPFRRRWRRTWRGKWMAFKAQTWPRWIRKVRLKLIDLLKEKEGVGKGDQDAEDKALQGKRDVSKDSEDGFNSNKLEEHSMNSLDGLEGCDKILVTDDMDLSRLGSPLVMMDVATGYMNGVRLEAHPRPGVVTTLAISGSSSNGGSSSSLGDGDSLPPGYPTLATPSAPPISASSKETVSIPLPPPS